MQHLGGVLVVMGHRHWHALTSGQSVVAPVGVAHTFRNPTDHETRWVTSFAPAGFERFFHDFGVPVSQTGAREASTAPDLIERVLMECGRYGMIVVLPKAG